MKDPFEVAPATNFKSTESIRSTMNSDGLLPTETMVDPFEVKADAPLADPFEAKHDWGTIDARDAGVNNSGMSVPERKGSTVDRMRLAAEGAFAANKYTGRDTGQTQALQAKRLRDSFKRNPYLETPERKAKAEALEKDAAFRLSKYLTLRNSLNQDIQEANPNFAEQVVGSLGPGMLDELNAVPIGKGKTLLGTVAKAAPVGLGLGIVSAWEQGKHDVAVGLMKQDPDLAELLRAGVDTALIVTAMSMLTHGKGQVKPKTASGLDPQLAAEAEKYVAEQAGLGKIDPEAGMDFSGLQSPYYNQDGFSRGASPAQVRTANLYNDAAARNNKEQIAGTWELDNKIINEREYNKPYWPDEDLQAGIADANKRANAIDNLPQAAEVKTDLTDIQSPYMSKDQFVKAQEQVEKSGEPAYGYMEIPEEAANIPYWRDDALEKAKATANRAADKTTIKPAPIDSPVLGKHQTREAIDLTDPKNEAVVSKVESSILEAELTVNGKKGISLPKAIELALKFEKDPEIRAIAVRLQGLVDKATPLFVETPDDVSAVGPDNSIKALGVDSVGIHMTLEGSGNKAVAIRSTDFANHGVKPEIIFHESGHNVSDHAWIIASDPVLAAKPEYANHVQFVKDVNALMEAVRKQAGEIPKEFEPAFKKGGYEFNTYGWTNKNFRDWLANVKLPDGRTALQKFKDFFRGLLGYKIESNDGKAAVDKLLDALEGIKDYNKQDVGEVLARRGKDETNAVKLGKESPKTPKTIEEAVELLNKDIGAERYIPMTANQKALFLRNPVIKFVYDKMREFTNEADVRFNTYKTYLHDVETFLRNERQESLKMLKVLADIQDHALKDARQLAQDSNKREAFLIEHGMPEQYVPMAIKILNVMQAVGKIDQKLALDAMGHNWHLEPMYFPREHTGPFTVTVVDSAGQVSYMRGFEHSKLAQEMATGLKDKLKDTGYVVELTRNEPNTMGDLYNMLNLNAPEKTPDFLKGITDGMLKQIEVSKRKFEMERAPHNIAGYTGETVYGSKNPMSTKYDQDTKLLTLLQRRLEGSFQLENKARLLTEIKKPLLDDPTTLMEFPNTNRMVKELFAREFGLDISMFQVAGRRLDKVVEDVGKGVNQIMALAQGREAWDVSYFKPAEIARFAQAYVWTMSIFKLGLSPSTLMANTSTLLTTPIDGVRTAAREGVSQAIPLAATLKLMTSHLDPEAIKFMKEAKLEGMVEARLSDPLTITNTHARGAFDRFVNAPRDLIEKSTNYSALLYYYNFYKLAYPDMSPTSREFKTKVYEAVRSWTGDYTHQAQLLAISKTGAAGNLMSNFAKWKFNQLGRLADDVRMLGEGKVLPFATTMAMTVLMAGAVGAPIAVEYEALRRLGMKFGWWDWKPLSAFLHELKEEGVMPEWAIKGPTAYMADAGAKELGLTAPDLSGNVRFSSFLDVNTLPFAFAGDVYKTLSGTARTVYKAANNAVGGTYPGNTVQQRKDLFKGLPVVLENVWSERMNQEYGGESGVGQYATKDMGQYQRSRQEQNLSYFGLRSKDENDYRDKDFARGWFDRQAKTDFTKYKDQIIANLDNPQNLEPLAQKIFELRGPEGILEVVKTVEETLKNRQTDSYSRDLMTQINNPNVIAQQRSLELLRKFRPAAK